MIMHWPIDLSEAVRRQIKTDLDVVRHPRWHADTVAMLAAEGYRWDGNLLPTLWWRWGN